MAAVALGRRDYGAYIHSEAWHHRRELAVADAGHCCEFCGNETPYATLHAHHLHYRTLGAERWEDLIVLCASCHDDVHEFPKRMFEMLRFAANRPRPVYHYQPEYTADELRRARQRAREMADRYLEVV
jgi:5-methylcytosine-specific restriction endonuclease McrA